EVPFDHVRRAVLQLQRADVVEEGQLVERRVRLAAPLAPFRGPPPPLAGEELDLLALGGQRMPLVLVEPQRGHPLRVHPRPAPRLHTERPDLRLEVEREQVRPGRTDGIRLHTHHALARAAESAELAAVDQLLARPERQRRFLPARARRGQQHEGEAAGDDVTDRIASFRHVELLRAMRHRRSPMRRPETYGAARWTAVGKRMILRRELEDPRAGPVLRRLQRCAASPDNRRRGIPYRGTRGLPDGSASHRDPSLPWGARLRRPNEARPCTRWSGATSRRESASWSRGC